MSNEPDELRAELERCRRQLRRSEARFRDIVEHNRDAIVILGREGHVRFVNAAGEVLLGRPGAELAGQLLGFPLVAGETVEIDMARRDASPMVVEMRLAESEWEGEPVLLALLRDVTARQSVEEELAWESGVNAAVAELAQALITNATSVEDISYLVLQNARHLTGSPFGFVGYVDPKTGFLISSTLSRDIWDACQVPDKSFVFREFDGLWGWVLDNRRSLLVNDPPADARSTGTPPGHIPITRFLGAPALIGTTLLGEIALANADRPYTEADLALVERLASLYALAVQRRRAEEDLTRQAAELARSNADLRQFAYVASHDLQEPLRMVANYVELLARRYEGRLDADADQFIAFALDGARRMQTLIRDLLHYSRVDRGEKPLAVVDTGRVLGQVLSDMRLSIADSGATITCGALPTLRADAGQLGQVFQNLIGNAIKFRGAAPPQISISSVFRPADDGSPPLAGDARGEWQFAVQDNGIGLEPEYGQLIFEIFQRLHGRDRYPGTGIGLALCKRIVERHGGRIWVESVPGQGSTFYFTISTERDLP